MKRICLNMIVLTGLVAIPLAPAEEVAPKAAPKAGPKAAAGPRQQVFAKYDLDKNKNLDVSESEALREDYEKNPAGHPLLKQFDTDSDGKMSDQEIMKILYPNGQPKPKPRAKAKPKAKPEPKGNKQ